MLKKKKILLTVGFPEISRSKKVETAELDIQTLNFDNLIRSQTESCR